MMKKLFFVSLIALTAVAISPSISITTNGDEEIHLHNHAEVANTVTWQCRNCGKQIHGGNGSTPPSSGYGCGGDWNKMHVWERIS